MNKLKKQKINNLLNYQHFLKNDLLKKKKFKLKNILSENLVLYKNIDSNIVDFKNSENMTIPFTVFNFKAVNTIENFYKDQFLFNYNLNHNVVYTFSRIMFNYLRLKNKNIIKCKVLTGNNKRILISIFGIIFAMKPKYLNHLIKTYRKAKKNYPNHIFEKIRSTEKLKKEKIKKIVQRYKLRYLNFEIVVENNIKTFSRISYLEKIFNKKKKKNIKVLKFLKKDRRFDNNFFFRKGYEKKHNKKKK